MYCTGTKKGGGGHSRVPCTSTRMYFTVVCAFLTLRNTALYQLGRIEVSARKKIYALRISSVSPLAFWGPCRNQPTFSKTHFHITQSKYMLIVPV